MAFKLYFWLTGFEQPIAASFNDPDFGQPYQVLQSPTADKQGFLLFYDYEPNYDRWRKIAVHTWDKEEQKLNYQLYTYPQPLPNQDPDDWRSFVLQYERIRATSTNPCYQQYRADNYANFESTQLLYTVDPKQDISGKPLDMALFDSASGETIRFKIHQRAITPAPDTCTISETTERELEAKNLYIAPPAGSPPDTVSLKLLSIAVYH